MITVIIPANNEEGYIGTCLDLMLASTTPDGVGQGDAPPVQFIVVANGCTDGTVAEAMERAEAFARKGWQLDVVDLPEGNKIKALNAGDAAAIHDRRVYIDADIHVSKELIAQLAAALDRAEPAYAGGRPTIRKADSFVSRRYALFWQRLPFMATGVPGCGVFAVNAAGRARWGDFPPVISDDTFVRHHFAPPEMHGVPARYSWPITEGFANLVRVRRRQDQGVAEIRERFPELHARMQDTAPGTGEKLRLLLRDPIGFAIYASVALVVKTPLFRNRNAWQRGR